MPIWRNPLFNQSMNQWYKFDNGLDHYSNKMPLKNTYTFGITEDNPPTPEYTTILPTVSFH